MASGPPEASGACRGLREGLGAPTPMEVTGQPLNRAPGAGSYTRGLCEEERPEAPPFMG